MTTYRVSFYKHLLNSDGHNFRCLQRQIDVESDSPAQALVLAEQQIDKKLLDINGVEVVSMANDPREFGHPSRPRKPMLVVGC